jgi:hypothetical protein
MPLYKFRKGQRAEGWAWACGISCREAYDEDIAHGLIYGPTMLTDGEGHRRLVSNEEASRTFHTCVYCGSPMPRKKAS